jgi:hypothetical protein
LRLEFARVKTVSVKIEKPTSLDLPFLTICKELLQLLGWDLVESGDSDPDLVASVEAFSYAEDIEYMHITAYLRGKVVSRPREIAGNLEQVKTTQAAGLAATLSHTKLGLT